ncbi:MAG: LysR family transcriptional regulator [Zoogloeaceae bacterium]|nr:LysR family transcriptional regulator [Rhodocyclaceae bacterium]MCP5236664.1 LysR family transcriptional regulator [Zoogloeaceae bacterium]
MHTDAAAIGTNAGNFDWNEVRFVLAIARNGTLAAASAELAVDQTTVSRRLKALEARLGTRLFEREVAALAHVASDSDARVRGITRITSVDSLIANYLAGLIPDARSRFPSLVLELVAGNRNLDLLRREADIAIRLARPTRGDLVIRRLGTIAFGVYAVPGQAERGMAAASNWLAYDREMMDLPEMRWLQVHVDPARIVFRSNSVDALARAAESGVGHAVLPVVIAARHDGLVRLPATLPVREIWLATPRELRDVARVRVVADWLVACFARDAARFDGAGGGAVEG